MLSGWLISCDCHLAFFRLGQVRIYAVVHRSYIVLGQDWIQPLSMIAVLWFVEVRYDSLVLLSNDRGLVQGNGFFLSLEIETCLSNIETLFSNGIHCKHGW